MADLQLQYQIHFLHEIHQKNEFSCQKISDRKSVGVTERLKVQGQRNNRKARGVGMNKPFWIDFGSRQVQNFIRLKIL